MEVLRDMSDEEMERAEGRLKLLLDKLHGEEHEIYDKFIKVLSGRSQASVLKKRPLDLNILTENDVFLLISPGKSWEESEIETVRRYVESESGILVAMTLDGRKPERLNKLLEPFGLSVIPGKVGEKYLERDSLQCSQLLEGVKSLALGTVNWWESTRIATSDEAEVVLQLKDAILGAKRSFGKGTVYLFSCLPLFGNKQLDQADNRRFLDNLLESMATPAMTETLQSIASDRALPGEKIVGASYADESTLLFFTPRRVIVAKVTGASFLGKMVGGGLGGIFGMGIAEQFAKAGKRERLMGLSPDKILRENDRNFAIPYEKIDKLELCRGAKSPAFRGIRINTESTKYEFQYSSEAFPDDVESLADLLRPFLSDRLSIED